MKNTYETRRQTDSVECNILNISIITICVPKVESCHLVILSFCHFRFGGLFFPSIV